MVCVLKNCDSDEFAAGLCSKHYNRFRTTGTFADGPRARRSLHDRLWSKIDQRGPGECWEWTAKERVSGYGRVGVGGRGRGSVLAHRAVWEEINGPVPEGPGYHGMVVMHTCDNRLCCNPAHLVLGTQQENIKDMLRKKRGKLPPQGCGEEAGNNKFTEEQIKAVIAAKGSYPQIAKATGVTLGMVKMVKRNKCWKHLPR